MYISTVSKINVLEIFKKYYLWISNKNFYTKNELETIKKYVIDLKNLDYMIPVEDIKG